MKSIIRSILIALLLMGCCLLYVNDPICAEEKGTIEIALEDLQVTQSVKQNVTFELYQVGDIVDGKPRIYAMYNVGEYPQKAQETERVSTSILNEIKSNPVQTGKTDTQGKLTFYDIHAGVYLLTAKHPNNYGQVVPTLLHLPYYEVVDDQKSEKLYKITVNPKAVYQGNTIVPDNNNPEKPDDNEQPNTKPNNNNPSNSNNTPNHNSSNSNKNPNTSANSGNKDHTDSSTDKTSDDNVKTGDRSNRAWYLLLIGITATGMYVIYKQRTKKYIQK